VKIISKNRVAIIFVLTVFLLAMTTPVLGATPSKTSKYEDAKWLKMLVSTYEPILKDFDDLSAALNPVNFGALGNAAKNLINHSQAFLKKSKGMKVSPQLKNAKTEAETGASYCVKAGKQIVTAVSKINKGDTAGAGKALLSAGDYLDSATEHDRKATKYIKTYNSKLKTK
jgi:hypothetical protein